MAMMVTMMLLSLASCSTKKNTKGSRFYHAISARFNTMYNGQLSFKEGEEAQFKGHQDDYTSLLPIIIQTNKNTAQAGSGNYDAAIVKCEKAIKLHSIKKRPKKGNGKMTPKEKEFMQRKEFNPYLKNAWLMMGQAQFNKGEFIEAASTFNYIMRLYATQPEVHSVARAWLAKCYVALEWPYDAEDVLNKMKRDSVTPKGERARDEAQAAFLIETHQYKDAIPVLQRVTKNTRNHLQRARLNFLTGQLYQEVNDDKQSYKYLTKVIKANPPYELAFNARILQSEVVAKNKSKAKSMVKKLTRMAKSDKNKDYLDQVYYAIGNIHLSLGDTAKCIGAYEKGAEESTKNGIAKAVLLLRLSEIYWEKENYIDAARTYADCVGILDKEHDKYKESERRSKILTELSPHLSAIKLQDSLQALAKMPEKEYLAAIDRVIDALKKKEKEEAKKNANAAAVSQMQANTAAASAGKPNTAAPSRPGQKGNWYFYNPQTVLVGKQQFQKKWGNRPNEDNWRRSSKRVETNGDFAEYDYGDEDDNGQQSADGEEEIDEEEQKRLDSIANDPHHREFYLKQIPFDEEQLASSHQLLSDGLYNGGVIELEQLENFPLALRTLLRLLEDYPDYEKKADAYYHMFLLYGRLENDSLAEEFRKKLIDEYPEDQMAILLANPNYDQISRNGKHIEDSIYADSYQAYLENEYEKVKENYAFHTQNFPNGKHRARIMFINAMSLLYSGDKPGFLAALKELIEKYSSEEITELAKSIVKGLQDGRLLGDSKMGSDIWKRRRNLSEFGDSTNVDTLTVERYSTFNFVLAYPTNSLDEDQLLFEVAKYNFTSYMVRNFEIEIMDDQGLSMMCVKGFLSYDEVHAYAQQLYSDLHMATILQGIRTVLISEDNLKLLGTAFSFDDYAEFYDQNFAPIELPDNLRIDDSDIEILDPDDFNESEETEESDSDDSYDDFPFGF